MYHFEKKFIFVHPPKCAGSSVRMVLRDEYNSYHGSPREPQCGIIPNHNHNSSYQPFPKIISKRWTSAHWTLNQWVDYIKRTHNLTSFDKKEWFIFGVVRNPFDRVVSFYHHILKHRPKFNLEFDEWIKTLTSETVFTQRENFLNMFEYDQQISCDYIIRQENIENDVKGLVERLNIQDYKLQHVKHNTERSEYNYRKFYNDETKQIVHDCFKDDIEHFGYEF
jgi:chondroitin 4-sulfotransferase 11